MQLRKIALVFAVGCVFFLGANVQADPSSALTGLVVGQVNQLHDKDGETAYAPNGTGGFTQLGAGDTLAPGDVLVAQFQINTSGIQSNDPHAFYDGTTRNQLTGISLLQVASITPNGNTFSNGAPQQVYTFVAPSTSTWATLTGTVDPKQGTVIEFVDNAKNGFTLTSGNQTTDLNSASTNAGNLIWAMGFTGAVSGTGTVAPNGTIGEGWRAVAPASLGVFADIGATESSFQGAASVTAYGTGPTLGLTGNNYGSNAHGQFNSAGVFSPGTGLQTQFQVSGDLFQGTTDYPVGSGSNAFVNVIGPEPSSLTLLGLGGLTLGIARRIRRRFQAKVVA